MKLILLLILSMGLMSCAQKQTRTASKTKANRDIANFDDLNGTYSTEKNPDDIIKISHSKGGNYLTYEKTRQVGGGGGYTNDVIVPFPTVCRFKEFGVIPDDGNVRQYIIKHVVLVGEQEKEHKEACNTWIVEVGGLLQVKSFLRNLRRTIFIKK